MHIFIPSFLKAFIRWAYLRYELWPSIYRLVCHPNGFELGDYYRKFGIDGRKFVHVGEHFFCRPWTTITDPQYTKIGSNVYLGGCSIYCHDASINMLNRAYGERLDRVNKVTIKDNVFVGNYALIMPGVTIGPNSIVGAGAVVTKDVAPGEIVAGSPARSIGKTEDLVNRLKSQTAELPWGRVIANRVGGFDAELENELVYLRQKHFFPEHFK